MPAAPDHPDHPDHPDDPEWPEWPARPACDLATLLTAADTAVGRLADGADMAAMADDDAARVMGTLTTLTGRLDALRVEVARAVRDRELYGRRGVRNLAGWLRTDARLADDAWKICRLAAMAPQVPRITGLLADGTVSLSQAGTACWQISRLPGLPRPPDVITDPAGAAQPAGVPGGSDGGGQFAADNEDCWAGLWRAGDVQAAADELFAAFLPRLDSEQLRVMGAHLREAADVQERASQEHDDFRRRGLRISRSLGGAGEITGRLHAEAAEQVIAAFEQLAVKTGPDDDRTKAQRWADVLTRLTATSDPDATPDHSARLSAATGGPAVRKSSEPADPAGPRGVEDAGRADPDGPRGVEDAGRADPDGSEFVGLADLGGGESAGLAAPAGGEYASLADPGDDDDQPCFADDHPGHDHDAAGPEAHARRFTGRHRPRTDPQPDGGHAPRAYQRPRVIVTVPLSTLLGRPLAAGGVMGSGAPLPAEAVRRLACDAEVVRVVTGPAGGQGTGRDWSPTVRLTELMAAAVAQLPPPLGGPSAVLDIGRKSPGWTARQRDALHAQYGGHCCFGRCTGPIDVIHHVIHWINGGRTQLANGAPLCSYHHWLVHEGGWRVKKHRDGRILVIPPPPGWRPGTIYRRGKPVREGPGLAVATSPPVSRRQR